MSRLPASIYLPRHFRCHDVWTIGGMRLKVYVITDGTGNDQTSLLLTSVRKYAQEFLPVALAIENNDHGLGYIILHEGEMRNWMLVHWWAYEDIVLHHVASAAPGNSDFRSQDQQRFYACVWEQVVIHHERDAWVRTMLNARPDPELWIEDRLADGQY